MTYGILGPLLPAVTAGRDRVVLALLLLHTDRVVSVGELVEAVWGDDPPSTARAQLQACVSRLRRVLPDFAIGTDPAGYRLRVGADELDALVFARLVARARAGNDPALFRQALDLWRGEALVGIDSRSVRTAATALDEQYAAAVEEWAELELAAGHDRELIGPLSGLVERFPLRERLRGQLIRALAGAGRAADALAEFRRGRGVLLDELGMEPGRELQELHRRILSTAEAAPVRSLPRTVGDFTGRAEVVARLLAGLDRSDPAVTVIDGMAGSGKTTLALHVASLVGDRYPDAHLFIDLHGYGEHEPVEPSAALLILLRQLGLPAQAVPADLSDRVTTWRSELARRRVLVVFDNARSSAQLADLLPTSPGTLALVTSRRRLLGLDGVQTESLPVLTAAEATALLARIAGDRVRAEPEAAAEVVRRCGGLPLALRLAGARLAHRPRWRVADLVRRLGESALPELSAEDRSVANAFALSYRQLAERAQRMFRLLGLYPAPRFDAPAAAALTGLPLDDAQDVLDDLIDAHLVEEPEPGIFRLHDLLREFAAALAADLAAAERQDAIVALLDFQAYALVAAYPPAHLGVLRRDFGALEPRRPELTDELADPLARLEWERPQLGAYVDAAAAAGVTTYAWWIPRAAWKYLFSRGYNDDLRALFTRALAIAEQAGDRPGVAVVTNYLASAYIRLCDLPLALDLLDRSMRVHEELGNLSAVATALGNRAGIYEELGRFAECVESAHASMRLRALTGDQNRARAPLHNLALGYAKLGRHEEALRYRRLGLLAALDSGDLDACSIALTNIQKEKRALGLASFATSNRYLAAALSLARRSGNRSAEAEAINEQALVLRELGRLAEAIPLHEAAIAIMRDTSDSFYVATFTYDLAITRGLTGDGAGALDLHRQVLRDAQTLGATHVAACAEAGIAACLAETDPERARRSWTAALADFREMGVPEQFDVERRLAAAPG
ncbi:AfsR/SARP family transcriptional regulator [Paractinoplanes globisporus]|uniref:BTAD domain-containing putative transcriptional regulator n=1 Tax=Paractinoplanes globisporus TaxID=113565 RepID=A0ABW6WSL2_9ACTN|nr:BTAD domain-containing putative transcriptional regulator [Actinoplanes globisporus]